MTKLFGIKGIALAMVTAGVGTALLASAPARAQVDQIKMMIPANAGGGWDSTGRALGAALQASGAVKQITYENKGGAGGTIGLAQWVNSAKADPKALMIGGYVMVGAIETSKSPVNLTMVTPLARLTGEYGVVVTNLNGPKDVKELLAKLKAAPGSVSWGGGSRGGADHIMAAMLAGSIGVPAAQVNYVATPGGGEQTQAVLGGHVTVSIAGVGEFAQLVKTNKLRALCVSAPKRSNALPDTPTCKEAGADVELVNWRAVFAAPGISDADKKVLSATVEQAVKSPAWQETLKKQDWTDLYLTADPFKAFMEPERQRVAVILKDLGMIK
jgi:putative tricarboxylic transport membrane protein